MDHQDQQHKLLNYGTYIMIWLALLLLTGLTVTASGLNLREYSIIAAIVIAAVKSGLVLNYFMNLINESSLFKNMIFITIFTLAIIIGLTFTDISFR